MHRRMRETLLGLAVTATALGTAAPAAAEPAVGVVQAPGGNLLTTFDTATPGVLGTVRPITGLRAGEEIVGVDYRYPPGAAPVTPLGLYAVGVVDEGATDSLQAYRLDAGTGAATAIGPPLAGVTDGTAYGMDFNPTVDRIRVVNDGDENLRINPNNGARADAPVNDVDLSPAAALVGAVAYDRPALAPTVPATAANTTLYALRPSTDELVTIGGVNSTPSPNQGALAAVGPLNVAFDAGEALNLDISATGKAYATASVAGAPGLYAIDLTTGAATLIGATLAPLRAFAVVPASTLQVDPAAVTSAETGSATVTVTRTGATTESAAVSFATAGGTAGSGDYTATSGTLTFAPGETAKSITVPIVPDATDEPDETFTVVLASPSAPTALGTATATVTITDDDPAPAAPDRRRPRVTFTSVPAAVTLRAFRNRGITVRVRPDEAASLKVSLEATARTSNLKAPFNLTLARKSFGRSTAARQVTLRPPMTLVGAPTRRFTVRVRVVATDAAGNSTTATRAIVVNPPRR